MAVRCSTYVVYFQRGQVGNCGLSSLFADFGVRRGLSSSPAAGASVFIAGWGQGAVSAEEMEKAGAITGVALQRRFHAVLYLTVSPIFTDEYTGKRGDRLLVERDAKGRFIKGNKAHGKSAGRPRLSDEDRTRINDLGKKGLSKLEELMDGNIDPAVQARVAIFCVEKAFGKAKQEVETIAPEGGAPNIIVRRCSDEC